MVMKNKAPTLFENGAFVGVANNPVLTDDTDGRGFAVADVTARNALVDLIKGDAVYVTDNGGGYPATYIVTAGGATWAAASKVEMYVPFVGVSPFPMNFASFSTVAGSPNVTILTDTLSVGDVVKLTAFPGGFATVISVVGTTATMDKNAISSGAWAIPIDSAGSKGLVPAPKATEKYGLLSASGTWNGPVVQLPTDPTVTSDIASGFLVGSLVYSTTSKKTWQCTDNTVGAAVWSDISPRFQLDQIPFNTKRAYLAGERAIRNGLIVEANADIPNNTTFVWGLTGQTWKPQTTYDQNAVWKGVWAVGTAYAMGDMVANSATGAVFYAYAANTGVNPVSGLSATALWVDIREYSSPKFVGTSIIKTTGNLVSGNATVTVASTTGIRLGMRTYGEGIPTGGDVLVIAVPTATTVTLSTAPTITATNVNLRFTTPGQMGMVPNVLNDGTNKFLKSDGTWSFAERDWVVTSNNSLLEKYGKYVMQTGHTITLPVAVDGEFVFIAPGTGDWTTIAGNINGSGTDTVGNGQSGLAATSDVAIFVKQGTNWVILVGGGSIAATEMVGSSYITVTGISTSGNNTITGIASTVGILPGDVITSASFVPLTTVLSTTATTVTLSANASASGAGTFSFGRSGLAGAVPKPTAADAAKFLTGSGLWAAAAGPMVGATSSVAGSSGTVPAPLAGEDDLFLRGDGTWQSVASAPTVAPVISTTGPSNLTTFDIYPVAAIAAIVLNLPAGVPGKMYSVVIVGGSPPTFNVTVNANGAENFRGTSGPFTINTATYSRYDFQYISASYGWHISPRL